MSVEIRQGALQDEGAFASLPSGSVAVISDETVAGLYAQKICHEIQKSGRKALLFTFSGGESSKTRETKEALEDGLLNHGFGRDTCIVAVGGGVVTDIAGFIAATYCRGVPLIMVPTTLLAMVDASLGGKNGVNVPQGKNLIGSFHQPQKILIDPSVLQTLPPCEIRNGIAEMIKHGVIADASYVAFLEQHVFELLSLQMKPVEHAIAASCRIKCRIVKEDEREKGLRRLLNFGHTIGHALECVSAYSLPHGEAVALGMVTEARIAQSRGLFPIEALERLSSLVQAYGLPIHIPNTYSAEELWDSMVLDKKALNGTPHIVFPSDIGTSCARNLAIEAL